MDQELIIIVSVFAAAWLVVFVMAAVLLARVRSLRKTVTEMQATGRIRVQKLKMNPDKNHAFHNPGLAPEEELSRRGYSMYHPEDVESGRGTSERQTGGQFVEELTREIDHRQHRQHMSSPPFEDLHPGYSAMDRGYHDHQPVMEMRQPVATHRDFDPRASDNRQSNAPPFLLQAIEQNKRRSKLANPVANGNGRQSDTNPNFIY